MWFLCPLLRPRLPVMMTGLEKQWPKLVNWIYMFTHRLEVMGQLRGDGRGKVFLLDYECLVEHVFFSDTIGKGFLGKDLRER